MARSSFSVRLRHSNLRLPLLRSRDLECKPRRTRVTRNSEPQSARLLLPLLVAAAREVPQVLAVAPQQEHADLQLPRVLQCTGNTR